MKVLNVPQSFGETPKPHITRMGSNWICVWPQDFPPAPLEADLMGRFIYAMNREPWPDEWSRDVFERHAVWEREMLRATIQ